MKKSITPICDCYTLTPGGNKVVVYRHEEEDARENTPLISVAIGTIVSIIAALIMIPAMYDVRGGFYVGGEYLFCVAVGILAGKVVGKIYEHKTRS